MPVSEEFLEYVLDQMEALGPITSKRMFGGAGIFLHGRMFALIADDALYLKADDTNRSRFESGGCMPFRPWPDRPPVMPYWEVPTAVLEDRDDLADWASGSIAAALGAGRTE